MKKFKKIESKKLFSLLMAVVMILQVLVITPTYAADDTRIKINNIVATSDIDSIPKYGGELKDPTFNVTEGAPAYFAASSTGYWSRKDGTKWKSYNGETFIEGTYKYEVQIRIDGKSGTTHVLDRDGITATVNGDKWAENETPITDDTFSYIYITSSKEYEITAPLGAPLNFVKDKSWNILLNYKGKAIKSFSVAGGVTGGEKPYTFSKVSGPDWISLASDGTVSGTPNSAGKNSDLVIRVTDNNSATEEITISVANTLVDPSDRTKISKIVANSDIDTILKYGGELKDPTFNVTEGAPAYFAASSTGYWSRKDGTKWKSYNGETFIEGTYKYEVQVRIDGDAGKTHVLDSKGVTATVDGNKWAENKTPITDDEFSYIYISSKEYEISKTAEEKVIEIPTANPNLVYNGNPQTGVNEGTGYTITGNTETNAGTYTAKATLKSGYKWSDGSTEVKNITWTIAKARPQYTEPENLTGKKGEKLSTVVLPAEFKWKNGDLTLDTVGDNTYYATFTPTDTTNYEVIDVDLTVTVKDEVKLTNIKIKALIGSGWQYLDPPLPYNENTKEYTLELDNKMDNIQIELTCDTSKLKATLKQKGIEDAIRLDDKGTYYISAPIHMWEERIEEFTIELSKGGIVVDTYVLKIKRKGNNFIEIEEPTVTASFVYDGTEKVAIQDGTGYTLLNHKHRNAGDYLARVTLKPGYTWKKHGVTVLTYDWKIEKADPTYTEPTGLKGQKGAKLSTVTLPNGFTWVDGDVTLSAVGENTFKAKFTPDDTNNYKVVEVDVKVMVEDNTTPPPVPTNPNKPTVKKPKNFTYDGTEKQVTLINFDESTMTLSGDVKKTDAGSYTLYISSKTGTWSDGSTEPMEVEWEIRKAKVEGTVNVTPITEDGKTIQDVVSTPNFTFNGQKVDGTIVWIAPDFTALPLTTEVVYQQSYTWLFKPTSGNFNQVSGTAVIYPTKAGQETVIDVPVANQNLTYNATEQIGVSEGIGYTLTNNTATNAGNYTATATLDAGYRWSDGTKEVKNIPFEIGKATPSFTAPTNLTGKKGSALSTVTLPSDFAWVDGTKILDKVGDIEFVAVYTPEDTANYESINVVLTVKVEDVVTPPTPMTYTVSFDGNDGGGAMNSVTVNAGDIYKLPACTFTPPTGKEFKAWEVNGVEKTVGTDITINADTILKAIWKDKSVTPPTPPTPPTPSIPDAMPLPFGPGYNPLWMIYFGPVGQVESKNITRVTTKATLTIDSKVMEKSVNGIEEKITLDVAPSIIDGRTMLPIRFVAEALGFNVQWINETRTVVLTDKDNVITIPVDTNKIVVNGKVYESDVKPVIKNGRTMLPIANIARALGLKDGTEILWDEVSRKVTIIREQVIDNR